MKDFKFSELILFGAWVRKRHPEMFDQLEDLYDEFYEEFGRFERNEKDQDTVRESSNQKHGVMYRRIIDYLWCI